MSLKLPWLIIRLPAAGITLEKHDYWQKKCMSCEYVQSRVQYTASRICSIKVLFIPWESINLIAKNNLLGIYFEVRIINHFESKLMDNLSFFFLASNPSLLKTPSSRFDSCRGCGTATFCAGDAGFGSCGIWSKSDLWSVQYCAIYMGLEWLDS